MAGSINISPSHLDSMVGEETSLMDTNVDYPEMEEERLRSREELIRLTIAGTSSPSLKKNSVEKEEINHLKVRKLEPRLNMR